MSQYIIKRHSNIIEVITVEANSLEDITEGNFKTVKRWRVINRDILKMYIPIELIKKEKK